MNLHDQWITEARILSTDELADLVRSTIQDYKTPSAMSSNGVGEVMARLSVLGERGFPCRWADYLPAQPEAAQAKPDWAVLGPRLAEALLGALPTIEDEEKAALYARKDNVAEAFRAQALDIRALLAESGMTLPA